MNNTTWKTRRIQRDPRASDASTDDDEIDVVQGIPGQVPAVTVEDGSFPGSAHSVLIFP